VKPIPAAVFSGGGDETAVFKPGEDEPGAYMPYADDLPPSTSPVAPSVAPPVTPPGDLSRLKPAQPLVFDPAPQPSKLPPVSGIQGPTASPSPMVFDPGHGGSAPPPTAGTPTSDLVYDPPPPPAREDSGSKGGGIVRVLSLLAGLVLLVGLAGGGWFAYQTFVVGGDTPEPPPGPVQVDQPDTTPEKQPDPPDEQPDAQPDPPDEQPEEQPEEQPDEQPDEPPVAAGAGVTFISKAEGTKKLQVNCSGGSAKGEAQVTLDAGITGKCRVTAVLEGNKRLTAVVDVGGDGTFSCFQDGASACSQ